MNFWLKIALAALAMTHAFGGAIQTKSYPQQQLVSTSYAQVENNKYPAEIDVQYPVQQSLDEQSSGSVQEQTYEPESAPYPGYPSQDIVQQYANSFSSDNAGNVFEGNPDGQLIGGGGAPFGAPFAGNPLPGPGIPPIGGPGIGGPGIGGPGPIGAFGGAPPFAPYGPFGPGAFAVQTGYEGFLVPGPPGPPIGPPPPPPPPGFFGPPFNPMNALTSFLPDSRTAGSAIGRAITFLFGLLGVTVAGGGITTAICTFTPLCTISFALPFIGLKATAKKLVDAMDVDKDTSDRVARAADFVQAAIDKFQKMQESLAKPEPAKIEAKAEMKSEDTNSTNST